MIQDLNRKTISVCMIVKNESSCLSACLESIKNIADEIILVDTGSTDNTIQIAEEYSCNIYKTRWEYDFSKARNFALEKAKSDYILSIDADEVLVNPETVLHALENISSTYGAWLVSIESHTGTKSGLTESYIHKLPRLFLNRQDIRFEGIIHEQISNSVLNANLNIIDSEITIIHSGYDSTKINIDAKNRRNLEMIEFSLHEDSDNAYMLFHKGKTLLALDRKEKALDAFDTAIKLSDKKSVVYLQAVNYKALTLFKSGNYKQTIKHSELSDTIVSNQVFPNYIAGEAYTVLNNYPEAYEAFRKAETAKLVSDPKALITGDLRIPDEEIKYRIGRSLVGLRMYNEARSMFEEAYILNPEHTASLVGIANTAFRTKKVNEAVKLLENALINDPGNQEINKFLAQARNVAAKEKIEESKRRTIEASGTPLLSLAMIVKNEEEMLAGCLESVKDTVDEIVIIDTGSGDSTKDIAAKYGARIFDFPWQDDFAAARNESLKHCAGKWILYLDADERLKMPSPEHLRSLIDDTASDIGAYVCTIESDHKQLDGSSEVHRGGYPRLFRNLVYPKIKFHGRVHEQITPSIFAAGKSIQHSDVIIEHLGYNRSHAEMNDKVKRNYGMLIKHVQEEPLNSYAWYQLGQTLAQMRLFKEAEQAVRFSLQNDGLADSVYASAAATLAQLTGNQKKFDEALHWADKSLEKAPRQAYALNLKAHALFHKGQYEHAEILFNEVLEYTRNQAGVPQSGFDILIPEETVKKSLEKCLEHMNRK